MQLVYNDQMAKAFAGMVADIGFNRIETYIAREDLPFGRGVAGFTGGDDLVHLPCVDKAVLQLNGDLVTSNSVAVSITIDGVATALDAIVYATSHVNTMGLIRTALLAVSGISNVTISDANNRTITVWSYGKKISAFTVTVTLGAGQASGTATLSNSGTFRGITVHQHKEGGLYYAKDAVNVLIQGPIWVDTSVAVNRDEAVYMDLAGAIGKFTNVSTNNLATGGYFMDTLAAAGLARVIINRP